MLDAQRHSPRWRSASRDRNARAAKRAVAAADPVAEDVLKFMYTDTKCETVPAEFAKVELVGPLPEIKRVNGELTYKDALKEALDARKWRATSAWCSTAKTWPITAARSR